MASANPVFLSAPTQQVQHAIDLREQAAIAKDKLPPGRRMYVDLSISRDVSWRQVRAPTNPMHANLRVQRSHCDATVAYCPLSVSPDRAGIFAAPEGARRINNTCEGGTAGS